MSEIGISKEIVAKSYREINEWIEKVPNLKDEASRWALMKKIALVGSMVLNKYAEKEKIERISKKVLEKYGGVGYE
jgi:hypothetical protein